MKLSHIWEQLLENDSITLSMRAADLPKVKRKLSKFKYRKSVELEEDFGRLQYERMSKEGVMIDVKIWLDEGEASPDIPVVLKDVENEEWDDLDEEEGA